MESPAGIQTEAGKAMTLSFTAAKCIGGGRPGFAALWAVVAFVTARAPKRERQA